jgi:hypothetical protein
MQSPGENWLPVDTVEFSSDPDSYLEVARRVHPWLGRFSQGYVVYGYEAVADLLRDDENLVPGLGPVVEFYGMEGTMWGRFMKAQWERSCVLTTFRAVSASDSFQGDLE